MKKACSVILLIFFAFQTFYSGGLTLFFYANRAYITKQLCVNKAKPELKCGGKCYLSKKLKEAEEQQNEQSSQQLKVWVEPAPAMIESVYFHLNTPDISYTYRGFKPNYYSFRLSQPVFHPPSA
mgnify:CR=1 FL=1